MEPSTLLLAGILLLSLITVESGGLLLLRIGSGNRPANALQRAFFRAGHAHAAVLLVLSLSILPYTEHFAFEGGALWLARTGVPLAAILMPAGFFLSVLGTDPQAPNRWRYLILTGAVALTVGLAASGIGAIDAALT